MNGTIKLPPTNEMVNFLDRKAPDLLNKLKEKYPRQDDKLRAGIIAGERDVRDEEKEVSVAILLNAIKLVMEEVPLYMDWMENRLSTSKKIEFGSKILASVSSASLMATLSSTTGIITYITGTMTLLGSLGALLSKYILEASLTGGNLAKDYSQISEYEREAKLIDSELKTRQEYKAYDSGISKLVTRGNVLCYNLSKIIAKYPEPNKQ